MKHLANIISMSRILLLMILFLTFDHAALFVVLYILCGLTDVLDGYVARKTNTESEMGARLDSVADFLLFAVITLCVILWMGSNIWVFLPWIIAAALIRFVNIAIAAFKYRSFAMLHTWGNKMTGLLVFIVPLFLLVRQPTGLWIVCIAAVLSAVEESLIHLTSKTLNINRRSIFTK